MQWIKIIKFTFISIMVISCKTISPQESSSSSTDTSSSSSQASFINDSLDRILTQESTIDSLFRNNISNKQILTSGKIISILSDDTTDARHQRFIIELNNKQTLLVAHNIDLGKRIPNISINTKIYIYGEYEWNSQGGIIHWTHIDPQSNHINGWINYNNLFY